MDIHFCRQCPQFCWPTDDRKPECMVKRITVEPWFRSCRTMSGYSSDTGVMHPAVVPQADVTAAQGRVLYS